MKTLVFIILTLSITTSAFSQTATTQPDSAKTKKRVGFGGERFQKLKKDLENVGESIIKGVDNASSLINGTSSAPQPTKETSSNSQSNANQEVNKAVQHESNKSTDVSHKADKLIPVDTKDSGWKDIHEYAQVGDVEKLIEIIEQGIYVDFPTQRPTNEYVQTIDDLTPLMVAVKNRKLEACKILMLYGADPSIKNADKKTALDLAKEYQFTEITNVLQKREVTRNTSSWQQLLKNAQQAYRNGEYVIANSLSCAALNNIKNDPTQRDTNETLSIINLLADSYEKMAIFSKAELFLNQAIWLNEKNFGNQSKEYATSLIRLCDFFTRIAYYDKSALLLEVMSDWLKKNNSSDKLIEAKILDSNGIYLLNQRNNEGFKYLSKSLSIKKNIVGEQHYEYGITLLKVFNAQKGKMNGSLVEQSNSNGATNKITYTVSLVENIVAQIQKIDGEFSPNFLEALHFLSYVKSNNNGSDIINQIQKTVKNISFVNYQRGLLHFPDPELLKHDYYVHYNVSTDIKPLEYLFKQKNIVEKTYGKVHSTYVNVLSGLANNYAKNNFPNMAKYYNSQIQLLTSYLETHYTIPEKNVGIYTLLLPDLEKYRNSQKDFALMWAKTSQSALSQLCEWVLNDKQKLLVKYQKFNKQEGKEAIEFTDNYQKQLDNINKQTGGNKSYEEIIGMSKEGHKNLLLGINNLAKTIANQGEDMMNLPIQAEFANGEKVEPKTKKTFREIQLAIKNRQVSIEYFYLDKSKLYPDSTSIDYYALIIKPGNNAPVLKRLFREDELKAQINYSNDTLSAKVKAIYRIDPMKVNQPKSNPKPIAGKLYQLCWKPIESELASTDTLIYYSPSGLLHQVSFAAITAPATPNVLPKTLGEKYNLRYLSSTANLLNTSAILPIDATTNAVLFGNPTTDLRYASMEVDAINKTLVGRKVQSTVYDSLNATEDSFKKVGIQKKSPQIIHVAAHGAYRTDSLPSKSKNPMMKSVLRMAGGKNKNLNELTDVDSNDGVLTAQEISELNFTNTQLVVLSACESGLGDVAGEEGVFGLQRAFKMAGAEYILASLWPIQDNTTSVMMGYFYNNLANKQSIPDAFNNAIKSMRKAKYQPYQWGAFVLIR